MGGKEYARRKSLRLALRESARFHGQEVVLFALVDFMSDEDLRAFLAYVKRRERRAQRKLEGRA
tara:strand:+ start:1512 stop:1703 length:192 start_codon:yes stop_codon:yes gene_type:complete